jgi:outer membrane protein TolC/YHS domain-containing protein
MKLAAFLLILFAVYGCASSSEETVLIDTPGGNHYPASEKPSSSVTETDLTASPLNLDNAITFALENNPSLKAANSRWEASAQRPKQARSPEDPMLSAQYMTDSDMDKIGVMLSQKIPWFGKLSLMGRIAESDVRIEEQKAINERWRLVGKVKIAYYDLFWINRAIRVNEEAKGIISNIEKIALLQYENGKTGQQDVLKARIELARINNEIDALKESRTSAIAALNQLLNRAPAAPLGEPEMNNLSFLALSLEQITDLALKFSPELKMSEEEIRKFDNEVALARKQYYPDWVFSLEYNRINSDISGKDNEWGVQAGINIPLWRRKYDSAVREANANQKASQYEYQSMKGKTIFDIKEGYVKITNAWKVIELYQNTLIPQASQSLAVSQVGYQTGKSDFLDLLDSVSMLLNLKLGLYQAQIDYKKELAMLELCCAFPVESLTGESIPKEAVPKTAEKANCSVTGAEVIIGENTPSFEYKGKTYYFCCNNCRDLFMKNPDKYAKESE